MHENRSECLQLAQRMADADPLGAVGIYLNVGIKYCDLLLSHWAHLQPALQQSHVLLGDFFTWPCASLLADMLDASRIQENTQQQLPAPLICLLYAGTIAVNPAGEHYGLPVTATEAPGMGLAHMILSHEALPFSSCLINTLFLQASHLIVNLVMLRSYNTLHSKIGFKDGKSLLDAAHSTPNLIFILLVWEVEPPQCLPPNWKPIHPVLPEVPKDIPTEIQQWIEQHYSSSSIAGLVVVSFGTKEVTFLLSDEHIQKIFSTLNALSREFCFIWQLPDQVP